MTPAEAARAAIRVGDAPPCFAALALGRPACRPSDPCPACDALVDPATATFGRRFGERLAVLPVAATKAAHDDPGAFGATARTHGLAVAATGDRLVISACAATALAVAEALSDRPGALVAEPPPTHQLTAYQPEDTAA